MRRLLHALALAGLAATGAFAAADAAPQRSPAHRPASAHSDWTRTIVATPDGGYRMGNPNARVKLVEYGSISCPHCAHFAEASAALRQNYIRSGRVSWEYRPFLLFPTDPGIFMLLRCQGAAGFFPTSDKLYADQASWFAKLQAVPQERLQQIQAMGSKERIVALVQATGTDSYFRQRGMTPARIAACLGDDRNLKGLLAIAQKATQAGVQGTPAFFVNGKLTSALDWAGLEPLLKSAGG